ncbi:MAG: Electron transfer flavoprotein subunit beta [Smithella sp. PtaU1.Bin162]|nr:MAG: Electron transfer flavoprotein subunit beta [Smithella sp. PtaU1.Bin162]
MPTIITCFKWVIDEAYIRRGSSGDLDFSAVDYKISDYDRNAIEEAVKLKAVHGGTVASLTVGVPEATKGIKDSLSRGPDKAFFAADASFNNLEPSQTASLLAAVIRSFITPYDLILCGEGSSDLYTQQVGPRLAEILQIPSISFVQKVELKDGKVVAERRVEEGVEVVEAPLPALVTVLPDINVPRIPGVKDTLMASKKPVVTIKKEDLPPFPAPCLETVEMKAAKMDRSCEKFGTDAAEIARFVDVLRKKALI